MSKFCTKCGRPIPEGGVCPCQFQTGESTNHPEHTQSFQGQQTPPANQQFQGQQTPPNQQFQGQQIPTNQQFQGQQFNSQQYKAQASAFTQNFFGKVLSLIKKPITEGKTLITTATVKTSLLIIVFQGIFSALFAMAAAGKLSQYIQAASGLAEGISSGLGNVVTNALTMPYFRIFLVTVLLSTGLSCILALMLMLGHMILKIPVSFQQMLSAAAIRSAVLIPAILLSVVIFELSAGWGILLFILINIWGFTAMIMAISSLISPEERNLFALVVSITILLFIFVTIFAVSQVWTLYLPDLIRTALKGMKDISWNQILEELTGNLY